MAFAAIVRVSPTIVGTNRHYRGTTSVLVLLRGNTELDGWHDRPYFAVSFIRLDPPKELRMAARHGYYAWLFCTAIKHGREAWLLPMSMEHGYLK